MEEKLKKCNQFCLGKLPAGKLFIIPYFKLLNITVIERRRGRVVRNGSITVQKVAVRS